VQLGVDATRAHFGGGGGGRGVRGGYQYDHTIVWINRLTKLRAPLKKSRLAFASTCTVIWPAIHDA
jgi:hypothetical protein